MGLPWAEIAAEIGAQGGEPFAAREVRALGGGCINVAHALIDGGRSVFVKTNRAALLPMFEAERDGLLELAGTGAIRVPRPLACGAAGGHAFLAMEYLELGRGARDTPERLGTQLAALHRHTAAAFGWRRDNTIGSTPQANAEHPDWIEFWRLRRLAPQVELARRRGADAGLERAAGELARRLPRLFAGYAPEPSLLHGDLWGGNWAATAAGDPVLFDPAVYYGDREADLAMTELFGGFPAAFYAAYDEAWPRDPGYALRRDLYNLYHVLNHYNLFGGGYLAQAEGLIARLLQASA